MGESFNTFQSLEPPLHFADERVIFLRNRRLDVENNDFKLIVVLDGTADLEIDDQHLGRLRRGDILVVPTPCKQTYSPVTREELRLHVMRLYFDVWRKTPPARTAKPKARTTAPASEQPELRQFLREHFQRTRIFRPPEGSLVHDWVREIQAENERRQLGYGLRIGALCRLLVVELVRLAEREKPLRSPSSAGDESDRAPDQDRAPNWATEHVRHFLYENYHRPLGLDSIAWEVRLSNEHLCRRFKKHTGQTVFSYLRQLRIDAAKAYLISSKHSVTEISRRVGFSSVTLFCRTFRTVVGVSPVAFRRQKVARISFERTSLRPTGPED